MLLSMTGYGKSEKEYQNITISIELRTLNGKALECNFKCPPSIRSHELNLRKIINDTLQRGNIEVQINIKENGANKQLIVNTDLAKYYFNSINSIADELNLDKKDILSILFKLPEIVSPQTESIDEEKYKLVEQCMIEALNEVNEYRKKEGKNLTLVFENCIHSILNNMKEVEKYEGERIENQKQKLKTNFAEMQSSIEFDASRLEQELFYYIERLDVSEEKQRLAANCHLFLETMNEESKSNGKKLNFICQEIGREINTIGSKANHSMMQKHVVMMKDELEKIKEQVLNIL